MQQYVFGYGSLMNPRSLQRTLPGKIIEGKAVLMGYRRKFNVPVERHLYLNIIQEQGSSVKGVLVCVLDVELEELKRREIGYQCVDVTESIKERINGLIFAFIAPDKSYPEMTILQSYINTCLGGVQEEEKIEWIKETVIENKIEDDVEAPKYRNIDAN